MDGRVTLGREEVSPMTPVGAWSVVPYEERDATSNLAETERLLTAVASGEVGPTLRWYGYVGRSLIIGVGQGICTVANDLNARGVTVVRRVSGGGAVLADREMLALDAAVPAPSPLAGTDVVASYRWFGNAWAAAIATVGATTARDGVRVVTLAEARRDRDALRAAPLDPGTQVREATCFASLSPFEVVWQTPGAMPRKLVGLSQVRRRGVALFQAGVHWRFDATAMASLLVGSEAAIKNATTLTRHVADLADAGVGPASRTALQKAFETEAALALAKAGTD
jgi:lipoate-protein ligase A